MDTTSEERRLRYLDLSSRFSQQVIVEQIRTGVQSAFSAHGVPFPADATILFDEVRGKVVVIADARVLEAEQDVIANEGADIALRILADAPASLPSEKTLGGLQRASLFSKKIMNWVFWALNGTVILYWCVWFISFTFSSDFRTWYTLVRESEDFGVQGVLLLLLLPAIPILSVTGALLARKGFFEGYSLYRAFFFFEVPALFLVTLLNLGQDLPLTGALRVFLNLLLVTLLTYWFVSVHRIPTKTFSSSLFRFAIGSVTVSFLTYITLVAITTFYLSLLWEIIVPVIEERFFESILATFQNPLFAMWDMLKVVLLAVPGYIAWILWRSLFITYAKERVDLSQYAPRLARAIYLGTPVVFVLILTLSSWQHPHSEYIQKLILLAQDQSGYESSAARSIDLVQHKEDVDEEIVDMLYSKRHYLFESSALTYSGEPHTTVFRFLAFPFVHNDNGIRYDSTLRKGYERAFGADIVTAGKKKKVLKQVQLLSRDVHVITNGSPIFATVAVTDALSTVMPADQEVVYDFTLPEHAVVTGLRLGGTLEHIGQIAPRGAAQETYISQVRRSRDPALLEQTGPRQYRLRVYPVPGVSQAPVGSRREQVSGNVQRVQFTYVVAREPEGIPLPNYSEVYNLRTGSESVTATIDGRNSKFNTDQTILVDPTSKELLCGLKGGTSVVLADNTKARVVYAAEREVNVPVMSLCDGEDAQIKNVQHQSITFFIDTSYENKEEVTALLDQLRALPESFFTQNTVGYVPYSDEKGNRRPLLSAKDVPSARDLVFFGKNNIGQILFSELTVVSVEKPIVLTGEKMSLQGVGWWLGGKITIVHGGHIPAYHSVLGPSLTVVTDISEAVGKIGGPNPEWAPYVGSYWYLQTERPLTPYASSTSVDTTEGWMVTAMTVRSAVTSLLSKGVVDMRSADVLHSNASTLGIVTQLSSYIALVNTDQQKQLGALSVKDNRYSNETFFEVSQPGFVSPFSVSRNTTRGSALGLSGQVTTSAPPEIVMPGNQAMSPILSQSSIGNEQSSPASVEDESLPRIFLLLVVFLVLIGGSFGVYRVLRRTTGG